jgi:hypothetical protein
MECGKIYALEEHINDLDDEAWAGISCRPCDRV